MTRPDVHELLARSGLAEHARRQRPLAARCMPYVLERMDQMRRVGYATAKFSPAMVNPPSTYVQGRVYGCFFEDTFGIAARDAIGVDQTTLESDYPHQDPAWPHTNDDLSRVVVADIPAAEIYKFTRGNALQMLNVEPELPTSHAN